MIFRHGQKVEVITPKGLDPEGNQIHGQPARIAYINGEYHYVRLIKFPFIEMECYRHEIKPL
jgi:hypothetical protein